jgi:hypothetical protein
MCISTSPIFFSSVGVQKKGRCGVYGFTGRGTEQQTTEVMLTRAGLELERRGIEDPGSNWR